jgi:hypothetical protein
MFNYVRSINTLCFAFIAMLSLSGCDTEEENSGLTATAVEAAFTIHPAVAGQGTVLDVTLYASRSAFEFGATDINLGEGITVSTVTVMDGYEAQATITVDSDASLGMRDATISINGSDTLIGDGFSIIAESFIISPDNAKLGEMVEVSILGNQTEWIDNYTWGSFGDDVEVRDFTVLSPTQAIVTVAVPETAAPGLKDVSVETGPDVVKLYNGFTVDRAAITAQFSPAEGYQGDEIEFTLAGVDTNFDLSTLVEFWDDGGNNSDIGVLDVTVMDANNLFGRIRISNAAKIGYRDVVVTVGGEDILIPEAFAVLDAPPDLTDVAVGTVFDIYRSIDPETGELYESIVGYAYFIIPLDPPCGGGGGAMGDGPQPYDVNGVFESPPPGDSEEKDCPDAETVSAGDYVWYESDVNIVTLHKDVISSTNQIIYYGQDLTLDDYRFDQFYDLHTQGDPDGIPEVTLEGVQPTVPGDYYFSDPTFGGNLIHPRTQTFEYWWGSDTGAGANTYPAAFFSTSISGTLTNGKSGFAGSIPWDDGVHSYTPEQLLQLESGPVSFAASSYIEGPEFGLPFSTVQTNQSYSVLSTSAQLTLE